MVGEWFPKKIRAVTENDSPVNLIDRPITKAFLAGQPVTENMFYLRKDGLKLPVSLTCSPIVVNGKPIGAIEVFRDVTFEKEVDRMKSEFISLASHQLRTPLSAIKTYSHMLTDGYMGELNESQKKSLETIISAANRMNELISTLLNVTRIESGTIAVSPRLLHIEKMALEVINEVDLMAKSKSISLEVKIKGKASTAIRTDSLIVKEILINLVSNAIKYTPDEGKVVIVIHPRQSDILVEVNDSGWGIPKLSQDQIFTKFFRGHNVVRRETTGTGLGLYLVKGLLEALGGKIWFVSHENKGTSFFFTLPRAKPIAKRSK